MTYGEGLAAWLACSFVVLLVLAVDTVMQTEIGALPPKLTRKWRIALVCLGPLTVVGGALWLFPPTRYALYAIYTVLIRK